MAYTDPKTVTYTRSVVHSAAPAWAISPPPGCTQFRVKDISASVTTAFVGTTTPARIGVGVTGNVNDAGYIDFGTAATPSAINTTVGFKDQYKKNTNPKYGSMDLTGTANTTTAAAGTVPEVLGPVLISFTAPVGGTIAGAAVVDVTIDWF